jgi:hypothetical protein
MMDTISSLYTILQNTVKKETLNGRQAQQLQTVDEKELEDKSNNLISESSHLPGKEQENWESCNQAENSFKDLASGYRTGENKEKNRRNRDFENATPLPSAEKETNGTELKWLSSAKKTQAYELGENADIKITIKQNGVCTKLYRGSITEAKVDAIVSAANEGLNNHAGVAAVISKAAGDELEKECRGKLRKKPKLGISENVVTTAGNLPSRFVIHAVGPRWRDYCNKEQALEDLYKTVLNILKTALDRGMKCVVMPPICSGKSK